MSTSLTEFGTIWELLESLRLQIHIKINQKSNELYGNFVCLEKDS